MIPRLVTIGLATPITFATHTTHLATEPQKNNPDDTQLAVWVVPPPSAICVYGDKIAFYDQQVIRKSYPNSTDFTP